jgi:superfamily II DNA or RNA helicase
MIFYVMDASIVKVAGIPEEKQTLWDLLSFSVPTKLPQYGGKFTYIKKSKFDRRNNSFGYGLLDFVIEKLKEKGIDCEIKQQVKPKTLEFREDVKFKEIVLEDYQERILKEIEKYRRGIIESPTASGKSIVIAGIIKKLYIPRTLIVVPTTDIARNTIRELEKLLRIPIGLVGDGSKEFKKVTVILYQSLSQITNLNPLNEIISLLILDEAQIANDKIEEIFKKFTNVWYRYGLSATPVSSAKKKEWFTVTSQMGKKFITVTDKQAAKRVTKVDAYMFPFIGKSTSDSYLESYRPDVLLSEPRCKLIAKMTNWAFKEKHIGNILILVDEYKQAKLIHKMLEKEQGIYSKIASSKLSSKELERIKEDFACKKLGVCIATTVFSVGTNIPETECIILGSARKSNTNTIQKAGRGRRTLKGKDTLLLLDVYDKIGLNDKYFQKFSEQRLNIYKRKNWFREFITL